jgi:NADH-quinone oxidoreductase subunit C
VSDVESSLSADLGVEVTCSDATGTLCVDVPREQWTAALGRARDVLGCDMLDWLSAVDEPDGEPPGVDVVAHLVETRSAPGTVRRMLVRTRLPAGDLTLASLTALWPGAAWHERETHEMFGVDFPGFTDRSGRGLRPLLLPDGFCGTPLRKSFVLAARAAKPWPGAKEPGESGEAHAAPSRRKLLPPGVPDASWGPRPPGMSGSVASGSGASGSGASGSGAAGDAPATRTPPDRRRRPRPGGAG